VGERGLVGRFDCGCGIVFEMGCLELVSVLAVILVVVVILLVVVILVLVEERLVLVVVVVQGVVIGM